MIGRARSYGSAAALAFLAACAEPAAGGPGRELVRTGGDELEELRGYAWNSGPEIPFTGLALPHELPWGELGRTPSTWLYLPGNGSLAEELAANPSVRCLESRGLGSAAGRCRGALWIGAESRCELELPRDTGATWTLELWLFPEELPGGPLLALPGVLELHASPDGAVLAELSGSAELRATGRERLREDSWNHLGVVCDPRDTRALRLVVNGRASSRPLESGLDAPRRLVLEQGLRGRVDELRLSGRAASTAELAEHHERSGSGPQRLTLFEAGGTRELEPWIGPSAIPVLDSTEELARGSFEHVVPRDGSLRWTPGHWQRCETPDPPPARTTHPTVYLGGGRLFLFGGETRDTHVGTMWNTNDTWLLDTRALRWTRVAGGPAPSPRCHLMAAYSPHHELVLLAGGWRNDRVHESHADTWVFHAADDRWEERHPGGDPLPRSSDRGLVYHPLERVFVLLARQVYLYDPAADTWTRRPPSTAEHADGSPADYAPGGSVMCGFDPGSGKILVFGGEWKERGFSSLTALYDLEANRYTLLDAPGPSARARSGFAFDSRRSRFVLFGGVRDQRSERFGDLWSFDGEARRWTAHEASNAPSARGGYYGMAYDPELDRFFLACGRHSLERFLDETWALHLDERAPGRAAYVIDRADFPGRREWFAETAAPGDARVEFRFRESADDLTWTPWSPRPALAERYLAVEILLFPGSRGEVPSVSACGLR